jgi:excinuclease ABC subunit C
MDIAAKNARENAQKREARLKNSYERTDGAAETLGQILGLEKTPARIEGYDISNTQGAQSVGSMVVARHGRASPKDYRIFRIKTVEGANDFASMGEVILRRLTHGLREREERARKGLPPEGGSFSEMPDLILIDGGAGQLRAAMEAMAQAGVNIPMFGLAKRIEEIDSAINSLDSDEERTALAMRYINRKPVTEIADAMGYSIKRIYQFMDQGGAQISKIIKPTKD